MTALPHTAASEPSPGPVWVRDPAVLRVPTDLLSWLTEPGLLTERVRARCRGSFGLAIVDQRRDRLTAVDATALDAREPATFVREIELGCDGRPLVFAQTLVPAATLAAEPWLAELGVEALGPRLARTRHAVREPLEFAGLEPQHPLFQRAWRRTEPGPARLWARRARYRLGQAALIVQEVFLPEVAG